MSGTCETAGPLPTHEADQLTAGRKQVLEGGGLGSVAESSSRDRSVATNPDPLAVEAPACGGHDPTPLPVTVAVGQRCCGPRQGAGVRLVAQPPLKTPT